MATRARWRVTHLARGDPRGQEGAGADVRGQARSGRNGCSRATWIGGGDSHGDQGSRRDGRSCGRKRETGGLPVEVTRRECPGDGQG